MVSAAWAAMRHRKALGGDIGAFGIRFEIILLRSGQQPAAKVDPDGAMESVGQRVQEKATDELVRFERHALWAAIGSRCPSTGSFLSGRICGSINMPKPGENDRDGRS